MQTLWFNKEWIINPGGKTDYQCYYMYALQYFSNTTIARLYWHKKKLPSTSLIKMAQAIFEEAKITNIEMKSHALLEIAPGMHSPVCPYLVEFSACVPPALHMGMTYDFHIGDLGFYKGPLSHFYQWSVWQLFFVSIQARNSSVVQAI